MNYFEDLKELFSNYPYWSVITAFLIGSVPYLFKYTIGVYISEAVKERRRSKIDARSKNKLLNDANKLSKNQEGKLFSFGRASASVYVLDYNVQGYSKDFLITNINDYEIKTPSIFSNSYKKKIKHWTEKKDNGEIYEGSPKIALNKITVDRAPVSEAKRLRIKISESPGYIHQRAATSIFLDLDDDRKKQYISEPSHTMEPFFSNSFGILIGIITGDSKLVFVERGSGTSVNSNRIICGAVEGMIMDDITAQKLDPVKAASRAMSEEFGINLEPQEVSAIKIVACVFNCDYHEWNLIGYIDLRDFGKKYISANIHDYNTTAKGHDSWEVNELIFIDFDPIALAGYLMSYENQVVNYSLVTAIYTLLSAYGNRAEVAKSFAADLDLTV